MNAGFDLDGTNGAGKQAKTATGCCPLCQAEPGCNGFTWYQGACYLKHNARKFVASAGRTSSLLGNATTTTSRSRGESCAVIANTDISGPNLGVAGPGKKASDCCPLCETFPGCRASAAFEFGPTGAGGGFCYFKANDTEMSGKPGSTAVVPGKTPPPPPPPPAPVTPTGVKAVWFFPRGQVPADLQPGAKGAPEPEGWGAPYARFYSSSACPAEHFLEQKIIFDLTLCGKWAGESFKEQCPGKGECDAFVRGHPEAFTEAYWELNTLRVYSRVVPAGVAAWGANI